MAIALMVEIDL